MLRATRKTWLLAALMLATPLPTHAETRHHRLDQDEDAPLLPNLAPDDAQSADGASDRLLTSDKPAAPADAPKPLVDGADPDLSAPP